MPKMDCDAFPRASLAFASENPEQRSWKSRAHRSAQNPKLGIQRRKSDQEKSSKSSAKPRNPKWSSLESKATRKSRIQRAISEDPQWSFDASPYFGIRSHIHRNPTRWRWQSKGQLMCSGIQKASPVLRNPERKKSIPESHWTKSAHSGFEAQIQSFIARNPEEAIIFGFQRFCVGFGVENPKTKTMFYDRSNPQILSL